MTYYRVTEKNVDGCGGDATEFVLFPRPLCEAERIQFQAALDRAKSTADDDGDDSTADFIEMALEILESQGGPNGELSDAPYEGAFEF